MQTGWEQGRRVRGSLIYITLQGKKANIEYDGIEYGIVDDLVKLGFPKQDIVLSFLPKDNLATAVYKSPKIRQFPHSKLSHKQKRLFLPPPTQQAHHQQLINFARNGRFR